MNKTPTILVIVGITGDLSKRYLLKALARIAEAGSISDDFQVVGISRRKMPVEELLKEAGLNDNKFLRSHLQMYQMDLGSDEQYQKLADHLDKIEQSFKQSVQKLFYLSVPPQASQPVIHMLGQSGMADRPMTKLLLEKPFGINLASAEETIEMTSQYFKEEQLYRIDHYLAKEMAQNLIIFRESNSLFKRTWNNQFIERIEINSSESIGIEGRIGFYEQTGALRDYVQSHLMQLIATTLMPSPEHGSLRDIPNMRLHALRQLYVPTDKPVEEYAKRGQYEDYREEVANPQSTVETFVSLALRSKDPNWQGVPIVVTTGKALDIRSTEIKVFYKKDQDNESNELTLRLQPNEGVEISIWAKKPGYAAEVEKHRLDFTYDEHYERLPDAYERILLDAIESNHTLFTSSLEVLESWRILEPVQKAWAINDGGLIIYQPGSTISSLV